MLRLLLCQVGALLAKIDTAAPKPEGAAAAPASAPAPGVRRGREGGGGGDTLTQTLTVEEEVGGGGTAGRHRGGGREYGVEQIRRFLLSDSLLLLVLDPERSPRSSSARPGARHPCSCPTQACRPRPGPRQARTSRRQPSARRWPHRDTCQDEQVRMGMGRRSMLRGRSQLLTPTAHSSTSCQKSVICIS